MSDLHPRLPAPARFNFQPRWSPGVGGPGEGQGLFRQLLHGNLTLERVMYFKRNGLANASVATGFEKDESPHMESQRYEDDSDVAISVHQHSRWVNSKVRHLHRETFTLTLQFNGANVYVFTEWPEDVAQVLRDAADALIAEAEFYYGAVKVTEAVS